MIRTEDVRLVFRPEALNMEMSSPVMITATGEWESGKTATWMLDKRGEQPPHGDKTAAQLTRWGEQLQTLVREEHNLLQVELLLMLYLGTARLWYQERYEAQPTEQRLDNSAFSRLSGYDDCLSATSNYKQFEQWYSWLWHSYREHQITQLESPSTKLKEDVRIRG